MIDIQITEKKFWENSVEGFVFFVKENFEPVCSCDEFSRLERDFYPHLKDHLKKHKFTGKRGDTFLLTFPKDGKLMQFLLIGVGKLDGRWNDELEHLRRAVGCVVHRLKRHEIKDAVICVPDEKPFGLIKPKILKQMIIAACMADYEFEKFKSDKKEEWSGKLLLVASESEKEEFATNLQEGTIIGKSTNMARHFADLPSNYLTPTSLAEEAKKIAKEHGLKSTIFGPDKALELGMGGFGAVERGSDEQGQFVVLEYKVKDKNAPTIALVGKGVTFDTGGVSLKPSLGMEGMKFDMSGAAAVIATMKAIAQIKPNVNVIGITPLVENMPSGKSSKQDDIITFMNGKTAEVKNTDAEGRLILADGLCYAEKIYNPDVILDIATLTGACVISLGHFFSGLMTKDEVLGTKLQAVSLVTGDRVWPLPLDDDFKDAIKSEVADISNIGARNYGGGTITAGLFLSNFVEKAKWAHIDIAGTADNVPGINYLGKGSAGAGVRLLAEFVCNYNK
jgi:leucyl aminopeptidase